MGVCAYEGQRREKQNFFIETEIPITTLKEDLSKIKDDKYACRKCKLTPEFQEIDCNNENIVIKCPEHGSETLEMKFYLDEMSKNTCYNRKCEICQKVMKETKLPFYHCFEDDKDYCKDHKPKGNCLPIQDEENKCLLHPDDEFNLFCKTCNKNICSKIKEHGDDPQFHFHNFEKHEVIKRDEYAPKNDDLKIIYLFQKLLSLIINSYEKYPNNYYNCINVTNLANFLRGSILLNPKTSPKDQNFEAKINKLLDSFEKNKMKLIEVFNQLYGTNITIDDEKINLRDKRIGDIGLKLLSKLELRKLKKLILVNNNISNIDDLKYFICTDLKTLNLGYNNIRDIDIFNEVNFSLEELDLNYNRIENINIFENMDIWQFKDLKVLKLFNNNFYNDKSRELMNSIEKKMMNKNGNKYNFQAEINDKFSQIIKKLDLFNEKNSTKIKITDEFIDLSSINKSKTNEILNQLNHPNAKILKLSEKIDSNLSYSFPKLNSLIFNNGSVEYVKSPILTDIKYQNNILKLKLIKTIAKADVYFESPNTFIIFESINSKIVNLIYYKTESEEVHIKLMKDFEENKDLLILEKGHELYEIKYYIDTQKQREIILATISKFKIPFIELFEFKSDKLNPINTIKNAFNNYLLYACMISDKQKFKENFIVTTSSKENIKIYKINNEKVDNLQEIILKDNQNKYFIDIYYNGEAFKYYIIIGQEFGYTSFVFNEKGNTSEYRNYKNTTFGENNCAVVFEKDNLIYLIGIDCKNNIINIFSFDNGNLESYIDIGKNCLPLGLNLWNTQYLIVSCKKKESNRDKNNNSIKIVELDDDNNNNIVLEKIGHQLGVLSTIKCRHKNYGECLISKGLDGYIKLWNC